MLFQKIVEVIVEALDVEVSDITLESTFMDDLGVDSLDLFQIITGIEDTFDIEISNDDIQGINTIEDLVNKIKNNKKS